MQLPTVSSRSRAAGSPSPAHHSMSATAPWPWQEFSVAYKKSEVPGTIHRQHQAEGNAITEVQVRSPAGRKHWPGWTAPLPPSGWHIQKKQQVGKVDVGGFLGVPLFLHKEKLLQCYTLHHSQVAKQPLNPFLHATPEPQEPSPVTSLSEPACPISPRELQTFVN